MTTTQCTVPPWVRRMALPVSASTLSDWIESGDPETINQTWRRLASRTPNTHQADHSRFNATIRALATNATPVVTVIGEPSRPHALIAARSCREPLVLGRPPIQVRVPVRLRAIDVVVGGVMHDGSRAAIFDAAGAIVQLASDKDADVVRVHQILNDGPEHRALKDAAQSAGRRLVQLSQNLCWEMDLTPDPLSTLTSKRRGQIRRESRRLDEAFEGDVQLEELHDPSDVAKAIAWASALDAGTYKQRIDAAIQNDATTRTLLVESAESHRWRAWFLLARGRPIACVMGEIRGGTFFLERLGFDHAHAELSPGKAALVRVAAILHERGLQRLDFGLGDASYKRVLGTRSRHVVTLQIRGDRLRAGAAFAAISAERFALKSITGAARRCGFDNRLRAWWRGTSSRGGRA